MQMLYKASEELLRQHRKKVHLHIYIMFECFQHIQLVDNVNEFKIF